MGERSGLEMDEFLLNALNNPRDRLTLLKLEQQLELFVLDETKNKLEFPPCSSYHRLILHRVAAYFRLQHVVVDVDSKRRVVLYKSPESRM